jgi:hypothetical protein
LIRASPAVKHASHITQPRKLFWVVAPCPLFGVLRKSLEIRGMPHLTLNGHAANARSAVIPLAVTSLGLSLVGVFVYDFIGSFDTRKQ